MNRGLKLIIATGLLLGMIGTLGVNAAAPAVGLIFAVAGDADQPDAAISKLAGIAPFYHLFDENGGTIEILPNPFLDREFGIGPLAAHMLADRGVTALVGRKTPGSKMMDALGERGVRFVRRIGKVEDVAAELKE